MTSKCPFCRKAILEFSPKEMPAEDYAKDKPWVILANIPCPSCGWAIGFGRFKTKTDAEAFIPKNSG